MGIHEVDLRYQETTEKTPWTIHEVVTTVTKYDKCLICESDFSPCQNDGVAAKTLIRAKAIPQGTQYIQYPVWDAGVSSRAIEKRRRVNEEVCRALSYPDTLLGEIIHSALGYLLLSVSLTGSSYNKCISCEQARLCFCLKKLLTSEPPAREEKSSILLASFNCWLAPLKFSTNSQKWACSKASQWIKVLCISLQCTGITWSQS